MNHRDASISDVTVVIRSLFASDPLKFKDIVLRLNGLGLGITNVNDDIGVIEGCCESIKVRDIEALEWVEAVRTTFSYIADFPAGDPRDLDGAEEAV